MELPRLRLRRVFEHPTHFTVKKPTGQTIKIAKKSLSPGTLGKLRQYAQGGEVAYMAEGGEAEAELEKQAKSAAAVEAMKLAVDQPGPVVDVPVSGEEAQIVAPTGLRQRPVIAAPTAVEALSPAQVLAQAQTAQVPTAPVAATPAAARVVVNVNAASAPAPVEKPAPEPKAEEAPVAEETAKVKETKAPAPTAPVVPFTPASIAAVSPALVGPLQPPTTGASMPLMQPTMEAMPRALPTLTPTFGRFPVGPGGGAVTPVAPEAAPVAPVEAAPAVTPVAPVAPVAPATAMPSVQSFKAAEIGPVFDAYEKAKKSDPNVTLSSVISQYTGVPAEVIPFVAPDVVKSEAFTAARKGEIDKTLVAAAVDQVNAQVEQAKATDTALRAQDAFLKEQEAQIVQRGIAEEQTRRDLQQRSVALQKQAEASDDLKSFFGSQGIAYSIFSLAALAIGGALSGYTRTPNYVMKAFEGAMEKDLDEQKRRRASLWSRYKEALGSEEAASALVRADNALLSKIAIERLATREKLGQIGPQLGEIIGKLETEVALNLSKVANLTSQAEYREALAKKPSKPKTPNELAKEKFETGRTISVGTIPVQRNSPTGAPALDINLANRNFAVKSLKHGVHLLEKMDVGDFSDFTGDKRAEAIATLAYAVENFPQAFGYARAVSKNAAVQLKEGLRNPTEVPNILKSLLARRGDGGRKPSTGLRVLRDEAINSRESFVKQLPLAGSLRDKEAALYGLYLLEKEENERIGEKPPEMPKLTLSVDELRQTPYQREQMGKTSASTAMPAPAAVTAPAVAPVTAPAGVDIRSRLKRVSP